MTQSELSATQIIRAMRPMIYYLAQLSKFHGWQHRAKALLADIDHYLEKEKNRPVLDSSLQVDSEPG